MALPRGVSATTFSQVGPLGAQAVLEKLGDLSGYFTIAAFQSRAHAGEALHFG